MNVKKFMFFMFFVLVITDVSSAQDRYWNTTYFEYWDTAGNWNTSSDGSGDIGVPGTGDNVFILKGVGPTLTLNKSAGSIGELTINSFPAVLGMYAGSSLESQTTTVDSGQIHNLGSHIVNGDLILGKSDISAGWYSLGTVAPSYTQKTEVKGSLLVGVNGWGQFHQQAGTVMVGESLIVGQAGGGSGMYALEGGTLIKSQGETKIGDEGYGSFYQSGGLFQLNGAMYLGDNDYGDPLDPFPDGYGAYVMSGGAIGGIDTGEEDSDGEPIFEYGEVVLGEWGGKGVFQQTGGTVEVQNLTLGRQERGIGEYTLNVSSSNPDAYVPDLGSYGSTVVGNKGTGTFIHTSGKHFVKNSLILGLEESAHGVYTMSEGSVLWTDTTIVGSKGSGIFTQDGGVHRIGVDFEDTVTNEESLLQIGLRGEYNLKDGVLKVGGRITNDGIFTGTGAVGAPVFENSGVLSPGSSPGILTLGGNYIQNPGGSLEIELGSETWYDQLHVLGTADISGDLMLSFWADYLPQVGMTFDFLTAGLGGIGAFDEIYGPDGWKWDLLYVDIEGANTEGWDLIRLVAASGPNSVPEPSSALLLGSGLLALLGLRRKP